MAVEGDRGFLVDGAAGEEEGGDVAVVVFSGPSLDRLHLAAGCRHGVEELSPPLSAVSSSSSSWSCTARAKRCRWRG